LKKEKREEKKKGPVPVFNIPSDKRKKAENWSTTKKNSVAGGREEKKRKDHRSGAGGIGSVKGSLVGGGVGGATRGVSKPLEIRGIGTVGERGSCRRVKCKIGGRAIRR